MRIRSLSISLVAAAATWSSALAAPGATPAPNAGPTHPTILPPGPCDPQIQSGTQSHPGGGGSGRSIDAHGATQGVIVQGGKTGGQHGIIVQGGKAADQHAIIVQGGKVACAGAAKAKKKP